MMIDLRPTADHRILPGGTAYQSDASMCGDYYSGMEGVTARCVRKMLDGDGGCHWIHALGLTSLAQW